MDVSTIWYTFQDLVSRYGQVKELKLYQFNNYLQHADDELLAHYVELLGSKKPGSTEYERALNTVDNFIVQLGFANGASLQDYYVKILGDGWTSGGIKVEWISPEEYSHRKSCSLTAPSSKYPVFFTKGNQFYIEGGATVNVHVIKQNTGVEKPLLVLKEENDVNVYDSVNSVQLKWPEYMYPKIIMYMLKYVGISVGDEGIIVQSLNERQNAA